DVVELEGSRFQLEFFYANDAVLNPVLQPAGKKNGIECLHERDVRQILGHGPRDSRINDEIQSRILSERIQHSHQRCISKIDAERRVDSSRLRLLFELNRRQLPLGLKLR